MWVNEISCVEAVWHSEGREHLGQIFLLRHRVNRLLSCYMFTVHRSRGDPRPGRGGGLFCRGRGTAGCSGDNWTAIGRSDRLLYYYKETENIITSNVWWANAYRMGSSNSLATKFCACAGDALLAGIISCSVDSTYIGWCLSCLMLKYCVMWTGCLTNTKLVYWRHSSPLDQIVK
jgi:hypothetical protein